MEEGQGYFPVKIYPYRKIDDMGILPLCPDTGICVDGLYGL